jgi:pimeloyl-ACP methyl ester carboxylesterase
MLFTKKSSTQSALAAALCVIAAIVPVSAETVTTEAADGASVYGETYFGALSDDAPVIALFHLAGGDGRGEYAPLTNWLNDIGFRAIAWDQRSGGDRFGTENRTAAALPEDAGYCGAYPDMEAALAYSYRVAGNAPVIVWGSSYSAALVFKLAADHPNRIIAVVAASPASGEPMDGCALESVISDVAAPMLALRPKREYEATKEQADFLIQAGVDFRIVENGVHGSSMLVDDRTKHDMSAERDFVASWLTQKIHAED